jgi:molybdenum cofactor cytidylyltransferase
MNGTVAGVVLAAGRGKRFGGERAKPCVVVDGRPMVSWVQDAVVGAGLGPIVMVVGHAASQVRALAAPGVEVVENPDPDEGIASSLHVALDWLAARGIVHGAVIGLADQPWVSASAWARVAAAYEQGASLAVATYDGVRANPVLLAREIWAEALALRGDEGARQLMRRLPVVEIDCTDAGDPRDVDTPADLDR